MSKPLLLRGGRVVTMDGARRILDADVLVDDGRIKKVGRSDGRTAGRSKPSTIDCTGLVILPGLVQAHIHLCQTLFRGLADDLSLENWLAKRIWPLEAAHTEGSIHASAKLGAAELLLGGTTAILDSSDLERPRPSVNPRIPSESAATAQSIIKIARGKRW